MANLETKVFSLVVQCTIELWHQAIFCFYLCLTNPEVLILGSIVPSENVLWLAWGYTAHKKTDFEVLVGGSFDNWVTSKGGYVPINAFIAGFTEHGESLYIGRVRHGNDIFVGKIHPSFKTCYIPDVGGTKELEFYEYEVLVV